MRIPIRKVLALRQLLDRRDRRKLVAIGALTLVAGLAEAVGITVIQVYLSIILNNGASETIRVWLETVLGAMDPAHPPILLLSVLLFVFFLLKNSFLTAFAYLQARFVTGTKRKLSDRLFRLHQFAPYPQHLATKSSVLIRRIHEDVHQCVSGVILPALDLTLNVCMALGIGGLLLSQAPGAAIAALVVTALGLALVAISMNGLLMRSSTMRRDSVGDIYAAIQNSHGAFIDARIAKAEEALAKDHLLPQSRFARADTVRLTAIAGIPYLTETVAMLGMMIIVYFVMAATPSLNEAFPIIGMVLVATMRLRQLSSRIGNALNQFSVSSAYMSGILDDFKALTPTEWPRAEARQRGPVATKPSTLELDRIVYRYDATESPVLKGISLTIKPGESVAFVGPTGAGKSTILSIILGLVGPQEGEVRVDGRPMAEMLDHWQDQIGYIPQHIFLTDKTIKENIAFGEAPEAINPARIARVLEMTALKDFVASLPAGLDTVVGERGVRLSGGQRQRLGIARALYREPAVLVMDEATSALDNSTEASVLAAINAARAHRTFIIVAHRIETVKSCDTIHVLKGGRVVASAPFDELVCHSEEFRRLANINKLVPSA